jgi:hypothetical protein
MAPMQDILIRLEPVLLVLVAFAFFKSGSARRLPAMATFLVVRLVSLAYLDAILFGWDNQPSMYCHTARYAAYFYGYWISYVAAAVAIFFVVQEVFKRVMEPVPGLRRLGLLAFRWISIVSVVICVGAVALPAAEIQADGSPIGPICVQMARCVSVMELCLLAFLALSIHALGRSLRSRLFGVGLGFGLQAAADLVFTAVSVKYPGLNNAATLGLQLAIDMVLVIFAVYFFMPEPAAERNMIVLPPSSMLARWNALAKGLGQIPQPMPAAAPTGFFLQDIEGVVDRVLAKNPVVVPR